MTAAFQERSESEPVAWTREAQAGYREPMARRGQPKRRRRPHIESEADARATAGQMPPARAAPTPGSFWASWPFQALVVAALAMGLYANTLGNGYALDDGLVIRENAYVQLGFAGIGTILTRDAFDSYYRQMRVDSRQLPAGRYRPLSLVTFAIEQSLVGDAVFVRHLVNVLLYASAGVLLLWLLREHLLRDAAWSLLATLLFVAHPIHTEAVANIKGRDEILSFLFIVVTLAFALRHDQTRRPRDLGLAAAAHFLALLSKEYGLALLVLVPVAFFVCHARGALESLRRSMPFVLVAGAYLALRGALIGFHSVTSPEVLTNPYVYASAEQALATKLAVLLLYLRLLVIPYPLSSDYSYQQIGYVDFASPLPWLSLALHAALAAWGVRLLRRRDARAVALFLYLGTLAPVSNLLIDIGAFMGERLVFHASLGFVLIVAWAVLALARRLGAAGAAAGRLAVGTLASGTVAVVALAGAVTIDRNRDWKDDHTLFTRDVRTSPNSAPLNCNASLYYIDAADKPENVSRRDELLGTAIRHLERAIEIHPQFASAHINLGFALFKLDRLDEAEREWLLADKLRANDPQVEKNLHALAEAYFQKGLDLGSKGEYRPAREWFEKAVRFQPARAVIWTNIGKASYWLKDFDRAREAWRRALKLEPGRSDALSGLAAIGDKNEVLAR